MANVKRTSMFLDRDLVEEAEAALGTKGPTETVHAAMREVLAMRAGSELADLIADGRIGVATTEERRRWDDDAR
jgi:Arc/MetJ family transcription regulator